MKSSVVVLHARSLAEACRDADLPATAGERAGLLDALDVVTTETTALRRRVLIVATGGFEHDHIPDMAGSCTCCGKAFVHQAEKSGYCWNFLDPVLMPVMRRTVRIVRWTRSTSAYLRGRL